MNVWTQVNQAWVCAATISWRLGTQTQSPLCSIESAHVAPGSGTPTITSFLYQIASDRLSKVNAGGATIESIDLAGRVPLPEGPGAAAVFQSIGWRDSLRTEFAAGSRAAFVSEMGALSADAGCRVDPRGST